MPMRDIGQVNATSNAQELHSNDCTVYGVIDDPKIIQLGRSLYFTIGK